MKFRYEGMDSNGIVVKGLIDAESRDDALEKVRLRGIFPTAVTVPPRKKSDPPEPTKSLSNTTYFWLGLIMGTGIGFSLFGLIHLAVGL